MILWINGPYGVGKSTLAEALQRQNPGSFIFDAETVGNAVRDNLPESLFRGYIYENYPLWFQTCAALLAEIAEGFPGDVYVPMTLVEPDSFERMAEPLLRRGIQVVHVLLTADPETIRARILARGETEDCWCMRHISMCLEKQALMEHVIRISTPGRTPEELAAECAVMVREDFL